MIHYTSESECEMLVLAQITHALGIQLQPPRFLAGGGIKGFFFARRGRAGWVLRAAHYFEMTGR